MAEFCLECLKKFEPNADEHNTELTVFIYPCDACGQWKPLVEKFIDDHSNLQR